jgi:hypothetical protein
MPIVLCDEPGGTYWLDWLRYVKDELLGHKMIDPTDLHLFRVVDHAEDAVDEILTFYRRYHSSRYVGDDFVMRLSRPVSADTLAEINARFRDLVIEGAIEQRSGPIEGEDDAYPDKARLVFDFDRRSAGLLRQMIDAINLAP